MDQASFLNCLRSLHNIDGYQLPELTYGQQIDFVQNPVKYFIRAEDEHQAAIWREVETSAGVGMTLAIECPECDGHGRIETGEMERGPAGIGFEAMDCPRCGGTGAVAHDLNEDCDDDDC